MTKHFSTNQHNVWLPYFYALGPFFTKFFEGFKEETIWGNQCPACGKILVPARSFCPECHQDMADWIEVAQEGTVQNWTVINEAFYGAPAKEPYILAMIRLDGTDCNLMHLVGGDNAWEQDGITPKIVKGSRVKAVWCREKKGHMTDIKYFQPTDE